MDDEELARYRAVAPELFDAYVAAWGSVVAGASVRHDASGLQVDVLVFAAEADGPVRFVTHGLGLVPAADGEPLQLELLLAAEPSLGGVAPEKAIEYVFDVAAHLLNLGLRPSPPMLMPPSELSPWLPSALLFDEPLREPESVAAVEADGVHVHLLAMIPLHPEEHDHIDRAASAEEAIDALAAAMDRSWYDLHRPPSPLTWLRGDGTT